jgi:phage replication initiation protein
MADGTFSPVRPVESPDGPSSNTGQKGTGALVDYLTVVFGRSAAEQRGLSDLNLLLASVFGTRGVLFATAISEKRWQFYTLSSVIVDRDGELVGRIGVGGNGDTICVSLSGAGTRYVRNWFTVHHHLAALGARISRVDVAYDDYDGELLNVHAMRQRALDGEFAQGGRPPSSRFHSDEGSGRGCTLYIGGKGHKELCIYEKGKQQGMPESQWTRVEARLYGKHAEVPLDVLLRPLEYLRGSYDVLQQILIGVCQRLETLKRTAQANGEAMVRWARRQMGTCLFVLREAFGDSWADFAESRIVREGRPARFRGKLSGDELSILLREQLCQSSM